MTEQSKGLIKQVKTLIKSESNNNPAPIHGKVYKTYNNHHIDILLDSNELLTYVPCICGDTEGSDCIIIFLNGSYNAPFAIVDH